MKYSRTLALILLLTTCVAAQTANYQTYRNARFSYSISYPGNLLKPQGEAANGDGQAFLSADGRAEMRVWGQYNVNNQTLQAAYDEAVREFGSGVSYKVMRQNWFVVSAIAGGKIHYRKTILRGDVFKTFQIEYDESQKTTYDSVTARVSKSFAG